MNDEKEIKNYRKSIRMNIKKNKRFYTWLFIFLILPLFVECVIYFIEKGLKIEFIQAFKKIFYILREYKSYYATILTLSFAIFSYNKQQEKLLEERQKENELKEKELEAKRDYYRPIFVIERNEFDNKIQVRLLMKDSTLYLEHIIFYKYVKGKYIKGAEQQLKSNELINGVVDGSFYITAKTLLGETILFYYFYRDRKKHYYYLKANKNPIEPLYRISDVGTTVDINKIWGTYNNLSKFEKNNEKEISSILYDAFPIRINLVTYTRTEQIDVYSMCYLGLFFNDVFSYLYSLNFYSVEKFDDKLHKLLKHLIEVLKNVKNFIQFTKDKTKCNDFIEVLKNNNILSYNNLSYEDLISTSRYLTIVMEYLKHSSHIINIQYNENNPAKVSQFLDIIETHINLLSHSNLKILEKVLQILMYTFKIIEFKKNIPGDEIYLNKAKSYLLEYQGYLTEDY